MSQAGPTIHAMPVGAEVTGLARGMEQDPAVAAMLREAWLEHGVLVFHGVDSIEWHLSLSQCFGELEIHPYAPLRSRLHPYLIELGATKLSPAYVFDEAEIRVNRIAWHRDTAYTPDICKGAILRMVEVPSDEGETLLADMALAWDELPVAMKRRLEGLEYKATLRRSPVEQSRPGAFWKTARAATEAEAPGRTEGEEQGNSAAIAALYPSVVHPAMLKHPDTGRQCIFLSPTYVDCFLGMSQADSDALLGELVEHMLNPRYVYRHRWAVDDAVLWDNRRFMHAAQGNRLGEPRFGLRTTLAGPIRTGRYFDEAVAGQAERQLAD